VRSLSVTSRPLSTQVAAAFHLEGRGRHQQREAPARLGDEGERQILDRALAADAPHELLARLRVAPDAELERGAAGRLRGAEPGEARERLVDHHVAAAAEVGQRDQVGTGRDQVREHRLRAAQRLGRGDALADVARHAPVAEKCAAGAEARLAADELVAHTAVRAPPAHVQVAERPACLEVGAVRVERVAVVEDVRELPGAPLQLRRGAETLVGPAPPDRGDDVVVVHLPVGVGRDAEQVVEAQLAVAADAQVVVEHARDDQAAGQPDREQEVLVHEPARQRHVGERADAADQPGVFGPAQPGQHRGARERDHQAQADAHRRADQEGEDGAEADRRRVDAPAVADRGAGDEPERGTAGRHQRPFALRPAPARRGRAQQCDEREADRDRDARAHRRAGIAADHHGAERAGDGEGAEHGAAHERTRLDAWIGQDGRIHG
jgi:hypothetical protein